MRVPVGMVAKVLSGDAACLFRVWWELRHPRPLEEPKLAVWGLNHARAVRRLTETLSGSLEAEVALVEDRLAGRADLIQTDDGKRTVHEIKTGRPGKSDLVQLMIYMAMLDKRRPVDEGHLHAPRKQVSVSPADVPPDLLDRAEEVISILLSERPPSKVQERACFWCRAECPHASQLDGTRENSNEAG